MDPVHPFSRIQKAIAIQKLLTKAGLAKCLDANIVDLAISNSTIPVFEVDLGSSTAYMKIFDASKDRYADQISGELSITQGLSAQVYAIKTPFFPLLYGFGRCEKSYPSLKLLKYEYMLLEDLCGEELAQYITKKRDRPPELRWNVAIQLLMALLTMQSMELHHNDLHYRNIRLINSNIDSGPWHFRVVHFRQGIFDCFVPNFGIQVVFFDFGRATWHEPLQSTVGNHQTDWEKVREHMLLLRWGDNDPERLKGIAPILMSLSDIVSAAKNAENAFFSMLSYLKSNGIWDLCVNNSGKHPINISPYVINIGLSNTLLTDLLS